MMPAGNEIKKLKGEIRLNWEESSNLAGAYT